MTRYESWGRFPKATHDVVRMNWRDTALPPDSGKSMLPFGNGRSYGDCCLNDHGILVDTRGLDRFMAFDARTGTLRCEAGVLLSEILELVVPRGWFLPVTPGTQFVTIGGAVANDVHGKNHHRAGTFGRHINCFELLRSDGTRLRCSPTENPDWFRATVGGLGLTGLITWVELQLKAISGPLIDQEIIRYGRLEEFFRLSRESDTTYEYTVAWIDCAATGASLGRGLFIRGNDATGGQDRRAKAEGRPTQRPVRPAVRAGQRSEPSPLQCAVLPQAVAGTRALDGALLNVLLPARRHRRVESDLRIERPAAVSMRDPASACGTGDTRRSSARLPAPAPVPFLAVLKMFGDLPSPGLLSFPRPGATLALDFPNQGKRTFDLLDRLDAITMAAEGALYPAKDARMSPDTFRRSFPNWQQLEPFIDPRFSSSFWRRVSGESR